MGGDKAEVYQAVVEYLASISKLDWVDTVHDELLERVRDEHGAIIARQLELNSGLGDWEFAARNILDYVEMRRTAQEHPEILDALSRIRPQEKMLAVLEFYNSEVGSAFINERLGEDRFPVELR